MNQKVLACANIQKKKKVKKRVASRNEETKGGKMEKEEGG